MPTYEYECLSCKTRFERVQKFADAPVTECPECQGTVRRVLFPAGIVFKGSGWYITDSRKTTETSTLPTGTVSSDNGKPESKPDSKTETKTEAKSEAKSETKAKTETKAEPAASKVS